MAAWYKEAFGNIFRQCTILEDVVNAMKVQFEIHTSAENKAELKRNGSKI